MSIANVAATIIAFNDFLPEKRIAAKTEFAAAAIAAKVVTRCQLPVTTEKAEAAKCEGKVEDPGYRDIHPLKFGGGK